ncbi:MAG: FUSC family protein [Halomonas subglaciescola]|nr:FUSC family protein [Halomonas subglaciescola]
MFAPYLSRITHALGLSRQSAVFGASTAAMALTSFAIASLFHLPNAFWAPMAVWIVAQPSRGLLLERGVYRLVGTLAGAGVGFALLAAPLPLMAVLVLLAVWAGGCAALTHLTRAAFSYAALMAGLTASVVLLPSLGAIGGSAAIAMARVICTLIGVVCVIAMGMVLLPAPPRRELLDRVRGLGGHALRQLAQSTAPPANDEPLLSLTRLEQQLAPSHAGPLRPSSGARVSGAFVAATLSLLAMARVTGRRPLPTELKEALGNAAEALDQPARQTSAAAALKHAADRAQAYSPRLARLLDQLSDTEAAGTAWLKQQRSLRPLPSRMTLPTRRDTPSALIAGTAGGVVTLLAGLLVAYSGWDNAWLPAMGLCTFTMVLSSMDMPQALAPRMLQGIIVGVGLAAAFRLWLMPHAAGLGDILLMLAPFMLFGGLARASSKTKVPALDGNMCFMLASQPFLQAPTDPGSVLLDAGSLIASIALVALAYRLLPRRPARRAGYLARLMLRDIERLCGHHDSPAPDDAWYGRMYRRLLRLMLHIGQAQQSGSVQHATTLGVLNLADGVIQLRTLLQKTHLAPADREAAVALLAALRRLSTAPDDAQQLLGTPPFALGRGALGDAAAQLRHALADTAELRRTSAPKKAR